jgi:hypothetical protein
VLKKLVKTATAFLILTGLYLGYVRAFQALTVWVGAEKPVLLGAKVGEPRKSPTAIQKIELARSIFGADHWTADPDLPICYYYVDRGYWLYAEKMERLKKGEQIRLTPFAMILRSRDGKTIQTLTSDVAIVDLDHPIGVANRPGESPGHVVHAKFEGSVRVRDTKGTANPKDDFRVGPIDWVEFDDRKLWLVTDSPTLVENGIDEYQELRATSKHGFRIDLRPNDPAPARPGSPASARSSGSGFSGARTITLFKDVDVYMNNVGSSGMMAGKSRDRSSETVPLRIRCVRWMRIDLPKPRNADPRLVGPPTPADPTIVEFVRDVEVQRGRTEIDQLNSDNLIAYLYPPDPADEAIESAKAAKPGETAAQRADSKSTKTAERRADSKSTKTGAKDAERETPRPSSSGSMGNLRLKWAKATGHAVWLQSQAQGLVARGNELIFEKPGFGAPDKTYFRADASSTLKIVKTDRDDDGNTTAINDIRTKDVTIYDDNQPGGPSSMIARGPGVLETRPERDKPIERTIKWGERLVMRPEIVAAATPTAPAKTLKRITLTGFPEVVDAERGSLAARTTIVAWLEPKIDPAATERSTSPSADSKSKVTKSNTNMNVDFDSDPGSTDADRSNQNRNLDDSDEKFEPTRSKKAVQSKDKKAKSSRSKSAKKGDPAESSGYRLVKMEAVDDVHLTAPGRDLRADEKLIVRFVEPSASTKPARVEIEGATTSTKKAEDTTVVVNDANGDAAASTRDERAETKSKAEETKAEAPKPVAIRARARLVYAEVLQETGSESGSIQLARLRGGVEVHQEPEAGKTKGNDVRGEAIDVMNQGTVEKPAGPDERRGDSKRIERNNDSKSKDKKEQSQSLMKFFVSRFDPAVKPDPKIPRARVDTSDDRHLEGDLIVVDQKANTLVVPGPGKLEMTTENDPFADPTAEQKAREAAATANRSAESAGEAASTANGEARVARDSGRSAARTDQKSKITDTKISKNKDAATDSSAFKKPKKLTITWVKSMLFEGMPTFPSGEIGTARAVFRGGVVAESETSRGFCEVMEPDFDRPIAFADLSAPARPAPPKADENADSDAPRPQPEVVQVRMSEHVDLLTWERDPITQVLINARRIQSEHVIYDKPTGRFWAEGSGIVRLYDRSDSDGDPLKSSPGASANRTNGANSGRVAARGGSEADRRAAARGGAADRGGRSPGLASANSSRALSGGASRAPVAARPVAPLTLTKVQFREGMEGRFPMSNEPGRALESRTADFFGDVDTSRARVDDEYHDLDPDRLPADFTRMTSKVMHIISDPLPNRSGDPNKPKERNFLRAEGNVVMTTREKAATSDRATYDTGNDLFMLYSAPGAEVVVFDREHPGQPASRVPGKTVLYNHRTGAMEIEDPRAITLYQSPSRNAGRLGVSAPVPKLPTKPKPRFRKTQPNDKDRASFTGS